MQPQAKRHWWLTEAGRGERRPSPHDQGNTALEAPGLQGAGCEDFGLRVLSCLKECIYVYPEPLNVWHFKKAATGNGPPNGFLAFSGC